MAQRHTDETFNGWSNYATWRIHLECFDGDDWSDWLSGSKAKSLPDLRRELAVYLRDDVETRIHSTTHEGIARDYALAFIGVVNWGEIAESIVNANSEDWPDAVKESEARPDQGVNLDKDS